MTGPRPDRLEALLAGFHLAASRPPEFPNADVSYAVHDTAVGRMLLACNDSGVLVAASCSPARPRRPAHSPRCTPPAKVVRVGGCGADRT